MSGGELAIIIEGAVGLAVVGGSLWGAGRKFGSIETRLDSIDTKLDNHIQHECADIKEGLSQITKIVEYIRGSLGL